MSAGLNPGGLEALAEEVLEASCGGRPVDLTGLAMTLAAMAEVWRADSLSLRRANLRVVGGTDLEGYS